MSLGGIDATNVVRSSDSFITATAPRHDPGMADVVVTNPGGQRAAPTGGFSCFTVITGATVTLTATPSSLPAGGQLQVSCPNPNSPRSFLDWIGIFRVGASNVDYLGYQYSNGEMAGTQTWIAPTQAGQYEFRYLLDDEYTDVARSAPIVVGVGATASAVGAQSHHSTCRQRQGRRCSLSGPLQHRAVVQADVVGMVPGRARSQSPG